MGNHTPFNELSLKNRIPPKFYLRGCCSSLSPFPLIIIFYILMGIFSILFLFPLLSLQITYISIILLHFRNENLLSFNFSN